MATIWDALDEGHGATPFSTEPSAYEQHLAAERQKRQLTQQIKRFGDDAMRVDPTLPLGASGAAVPKETEQFERGYVMRMPGSKAPKQESKDPLRSLLKAMQITGSKSQGTPKSDGTKSPRTSKAGESDDGAAGGVQLREASLAKLVTAAPASALKDIAGDVSKSTAATQTGMDALASASSKLNGASPDERIRLLQELQRSPELQDLVKAGLMNWDDMLVKNPPAGSDNHVSNPAGDDPAYVIDSKKLADLRRKLAAYGAKQTATLQNVQQAVARRRTTPGSVPSAQDAIFPGVKVWTPVAWAPAPRPGA